MGAAQRLDLGLMAVLGLASSLHCVTMCGPLLAVASAPLVGGGATRGLTLLAWQACYHLGRGLTYVAIGAGLGLAGGSLPSLIPTRLVGGIVQLGVGLVIVGLGVWQLLRRGARGVAPGGRLNRTVGRLVTSGHGPGMLGLGLVTGLLPCGVLYAAFARAVASSGGWDGAALMLAFWLGTVPLLAGLGLVSGKAVGLVGRHAAALLFVAMLATGGWLTVKGCRTLAAPAAGMAAATSCGAHTMAH